MGPRNPVDPYGVTPRRGLPTSARVVSQYPAGVPTGVGGGNAGASTASQWNPAPARRQPSAAPGPAPASAPAPVPSRNVPVTIGPARSRAAELNRQAQQAGVPPQQLSYVPDGENIRLAQDNRAAMIAAQRKAGEAISPNLTPASESYYNDADIAAWAAKNPVLANKLRERNGLDPLDAQGRAPFAINNLGLNDARQAAINNVGYAATAPNLMAGRTMPAPQYDVPASAWNIDPRTEMAYGGGVNFRPGADQGGMFSRLGDPRVTQMAYDPNLDLMGSGAPRQGAGFSSSRNIPFDPNLDLMGGRSGASAPPAVSGYDAGFGIQPLDSQENYSSAFGGKPSRSPGFNLSAQLGRGLGNGAQQYFR